jgi:hypothetical protein
VRQQALQFKYAVYVEGHSAANRYGELMRAQFVILKADSTCEGSQLFFFRQLQPWVDHVPVKADLSDLQERIAWLQAHDQEARRIAEAAAAAWHRLLSRGAMLHYCAQTILGLKIKSSA